MQFKVVIKQSMTNDGQARWVTISYGDRHYHGLLDSWQDVYAKMEELIKAWGVWE